MGVALGTGMVVALLVGVGLRARSAGPLWPTVFHAVLAVCGVALFGAVGSGMLTGISVVGAALVATAPLLALPIPTTPGRLNLGATGIAMGPAAAAAALGSLGTSNVAVMAGPGPLLALAMGAGGLLAASLGFGLRALCRLQAAQTDERTSPGLPALAVGLVVLAYLALAAPGGDASITQLPVAGADSAVALWMTDANLGIAATLAQPQLGGLLLAAALLGLVGAFYPQRKVGAMAAGVAGLVALVAFGWALSMHGAPVELDEAMGRALISAFVVDPSLLDPPRLMSAGPYHLDVTAAGVALALLVSAGLGAVGWAADEYSVKPVDDRASLLLSLGGRDAFQVSVITTWLGLAIFLVLQHARFGVWGPHAPADHILTSGAFAMATVLAVLYGVGGRQGALWDAARAVAVAIGVTFVVGTMAGGLAGAVGVFGL